MQRLNLPKRHGNLQGRLDCHGPAALAMTKGEVIARAKDRRGGGERLAMTISPT
jgi:hypothetical protein